jgi:hypothetical protein
MRRVRPSAKERTIRKTGLQLSPKTYFACLADPVTTAAGRRWFMGTRTPHTTKSATSSRFQTPANAQSMSTRVSL